MRKLLDKIPDGWKAWGRLWGFWRKDWWMADDELSKRLDDAEREYDRMNGRL